MKTNIIALPPDYIIDPATITEDGFSTCYKCGRKFHVATDYNHNKDKINIFWNLQRCMRCVDKSLFPKRIKRIKLAIKYFIEDKILFRKILHRTN